jgi:hypothetical protein
MAEIGGGSVLAAVSAMIAITVTRTLVGYGVPDDDIKKYLSLIKEGGHLLAVHVKDSTLASQAIDILKNHGGEYISIYKTQLDPANWKKENFDKTVSP